MEKHDPGLFLVYALLLNKTEFKSIQPSKPLYFSDRKKAEETIRRYSEYFPFLYIDAQSDERVYCLIMEQYALNTTYRYQLSTWVYSADGILLSDCIIPDDGPFLGRQKSGICHEIGEVVETPCGDRLVYGIVVEQPICFNDDHQKYGYTASDDCYTILRYPDKEIYYAHVPLVFKPSESISAIVQEELQLAYQQTLTEKEMYAEEEMQAERQV
jgi:hypothetical protein